MTQWKLVPVEPTREMIEAAFGAINYTMPEPSEDAGRVYSAMLSAAPSPDGEEVERVSKVIYEIIDRHQRYFGASFQMDGHLADECAAAAIAAMRPTLSEEDRARVEEVRGRANTFSGRFWEVGPQTRVAMIDRIVQDRAFLLSLIDKLANQEPAMTDMTTDLVKRLEAGERCGECRYFKCHRQDLGMCQSPSQAATRGADKGRGWVQTEPSDRCWSGDFELLKAEG